MPIINFIKKNILNNQSKQLGFLKSKKNYETKQKSIAYIL